MVEDAETALRLARQRPDATFVSLDGALLGPGGQGSAGRPLGEDDGILETKAQHERLEDEVSKLRARTTSVLGGDANDHYREYNKWWLLGYISARNYAIELLGTDGVAGKNVENEEIYALALSFCQANQEKNWDDAAIHVYDILE